MPLKSMNQNNMEWFQGLIMRTRLTNLPKRILQNHLVDKTDLSKKNNGMVSMGIKEGRIFMAGQAQLLKV